jgi:hypothetical protein
MSMTPEEEISLQAIQYRTNGLEAYLNRDLGLFMQQFETLQELFYKPASNENFNTAFQLFYRIFDVVPLLVNRLNDLSIFRAQTNKPNELFSTQSRISYNKTNPDIITPGKFNAWGEPMFYGSLPYMPKEKEKFFPPSLTACLETCKDLYNPEKMVLLQDFTVGRWTINETLNVVNLVFDEVHLSHNQELKVSNDAYIEKLLRNLDSKAGDFVKELFSYYSRLCRTGSNEGAYYVLTALYTAIRLYYESIGAEVNGMISSSAATDGMGLNIVMTPAAVEHYLTLNAVTMYRYFLVMPEARKYAIYHSSEIIENYRNLPEFNYTFKQYLPPAERFLAKIPYR